MQKVEDGHGGNGSGEKGNEKDKQDKIRTADDDKKTSDLYAGLAAGGTDQSEQQQQPPESEQQRDYALEQYQAEGFQQNSDGLYFNPWTDEYDENYDPHNDSTYNQQRQVQQSEPEQLQPQPQPQPQPTGSQMPKGSRIRALGQALGREVDFVSKTGSKSKKEAALKMGAAAGKKVLGTGFKGAGIAAGAMLGAATGIVAGDPGAVFKNASVGAGTGAALTSGINNRVAKGVDNFAKEAKNTQEQWEKDYYGQDYDKAMKIKADNEFRNNKEIRKLYKEKLNLNTKEEIDLAMEDAVKYRQYGINDNSIIIKAMKSDNGNPQNRADNRRIAAAKLAENSKTEKDFQTNMKRFEKTPGIKERQVQDMERLVRGINNL